MPKQLPDVSKNTTAEVNASNNAPGWTIDSSNYIVDDTYLKLRLDSCTTPTGAKVGTYYVLELAD